MIKFLYIVSLAITSFVLFIFSGEKEASTCTHEVSGIIQAVSENDQQHLVIISDDNRVYKPVRMNPGVVLAAGKKVSICYSGVSTTENATISAVNIHTITYLAQEGDAAFVK